MRSTAAARWPTVKVLLILETMMSIYVSGSTYVVIRFGNSNACLRLAARVDRPVEPATIHYHLGITPRIDGCAATTPLSVRAVLRDGGGRSPNGSSALFFHDPPTW